MSASPPLQPLLDAHARGGEGVPEPGRCVHLLVDPHAAVIVDAAGATRELLHAGANDLRGLPLQTLAAPDEWLDPSAGWAFARRASAGAGLGAPGGTHWLTVHTRRGQRRLLQASLTTFERAHAGRALCLIQLEEPGPAHATGEAADSMAAHAVEREVATQRHLRSLAYQITVAEARERERVANGLHDTLGQLLAVAQFRLGELETQLDHPPRPGAGQPATPSPPQGTEVHGLLRELRQLLAEASRETRQTTFELHSPVLQQLGMVAAAESLAERFSRQCRLPVQVEAVGRAQLARLPPAHAEYTVLLRVLHELLLNAHKHAQAAAAEVRIEYTHGELQIHVSDNGRGYDATQPLPACGPEGGFGLSSAEAQMLAIRGRLVRRSSPGTGTQATLAWPCTLTPPPSDESAS